MLHVDHRAPAPHGRDVHVEVSKQGAPRARVALRRIAERARRMLTALALDSSELSVVLCDDATIHALNRDFRKKDRPTDVLAFSMHEGEHAEHAGAMLGDVVISLDTAARQAREKKVSFDREVTMLLAHGLLHLCGYDHRDRTEERRMWARMDALIAVAYAGKPPQRAHTIARDRVKTR
jgi:probable rRNA maturation factor